MRYLADSILNPFEIRHLFNSVSGGPYLGVYTQHLPALHILADFGLPEMCEHISTENMEDATTAERSVGG
jgi:hypothetical protein